MWLLNKFCVYRIVTCRPPSHISILTHALSQFYEVDKNNSSFNLKSKMSDKFTNDLIYRVSYLIRNCYYPKYVT